MGIFSKSKGVTIQEAKIQFNKGNIRKSLKLCKEFLSVNDNDFEGLNLLGDLYYKNNDKNNSLDIFRKLITQLESDRYTDKAIAVIRKIIRMFPDQYDLYRKLSKLFEKKGFVAEQLKILYELSNIYHENGLEDKAIDILKEIVEIDRTNLTNYLEIIKKFDSLGKKFEITKIIYPALELARKKDNIDAITTFVEIAIKNKTELTDAIRFTTPYFKENSENIDVFNENAKVSLLKEYDKLLFSEFTSLNDYSKIIDTVDEIKNKYQELTVYDYLLEQQLKTNTPSGFLSLLNEINALPDYLFDASYAEIIGKYVESIADVESLDMMVTIAGKCNAKDLQVGLYKKLSSIYRDMNDTEKAERILEYINEIEYSDSGVPSGVGGTPFEDVEIAPEAEESIADLIESTSYDESVDDNSLNDDSFDFDLDDDTDNSIDDFALNLDEEETSNSMETETHIEEFNLDIEEGEVEEFSLEEEVDENTDDDITFELTLDEEEDDLIDLSETSEEISSELEEFNLDDLPDEEDIFGDVHAEVESSHEMSLDDEISAIHLLIDGGKTDQAKSDLERLLADYPENIELKTLVSTLILSEKKSQTISEEPLDDAQEQISDMIYGFKSVADNIRKSIDAQVSPDDYETHYDLAMAYMEMELFDEALEELKKSATGSKKYESLFLMAECYKRMAKHEDSLNVHKLIIIDYNDQDKLKNSLYEMAVTSELKGDQNSANNFYQKISRLDPDFRNVKAKLSGVASESNTMFKEGEDLDIKEQVPIKGKKKKKISFL